MFGGFDLKKTLFGCMVKDESKVMFDLCCKRAASIGRAEFVRTDGRINFEEVYRTDMQKFLVYLAFADGNICKEEARFISELLGKDMPVHVIIDYAEQWDLMSEHIKDTPPLSLEPFVRSTVGAETGEISNQYYDMLTLYVTTFNFVGNDLISCNDDVSQGELDALTSYIMMLRENIAIIKEKHQAFVPSIEYKKGSVAKLEDPAFDEIEEYIDDIEAGKKFSLRKDGKNASDERTSSTGNPDDRVYYADDRRRLSSNIKPKDNSTSEKKVYAEIDEDEQETKFVGRVELASDELSLEQLLSELNSLTGMESVKKEVNNLVNLMKICKIRQEKGLQIPPMTNHLVFLGNPGTGKTTIARILAKIYHKIGVLSKGQLVEVDRSGLVAGYMGQTGIKVMEVVERAKGGVLFIDEAYALTASKNDGDFGQEAIDVLNKAMEDFKDDLIVIAAGYEKEMQSFLDANPGLRSRFNRTIEFPDYSAGELIEIMTKRAAKLDYVIDDEALAYIADVFEATLEEEPDNFGNARSVRNYLDNAINNQANRLITQTDLDESKLTLITLEDVKNLVLE